jgi:hypothetical protein
MALTDRAPLSELKRNAWAAAIVIAVIMVGAFIVVQVLS